jgi:hypothetical protein
MGGEVYAREPRISADPLPVAVASSGYAATDGKAAVAAGRMVA